jgi:hypothetical protein
MSYVVATSIFKQHIVRRIMGAKDSYANTNLVFHVKLYTKRAKTPPFLAALSYFHVITYFIVAFVGGIFLFSRHSFIVAF